MKNVIKILGIIALFTVIWFSFAACDTGGGGGSGGGGGAAPAITKTSLLDGRTGTAYSQTLTATGDTPITWSIDTGTLPGGLSLSAAGVISGTPADAGNFDFTVKAANAAGSGTRALSITIYTIDDITPFNGTWNANGGRSIVFTGNNFDYKVNNETKYSGTFSVYGLAITFNETSLGEAIGNFSLSGNTLTLSDHTWDSNVNGTYTKDGGNGNAGTFLNGTWSRTSGSYTYSIVLDNNNWTYYDGNDPVSKGTWTSSVTPAAGTNGTITLTITQVDMGSGWVSLPAEYNSLKTCTAKYSINSGGNQLTLSEKQLTAADPTGMWSKLEGTYTKDGGTGGGDGGGGNAGTYIITGSGTTFTATKNGTTVGRANVGAANVLSNIKNNASGANCTIQFGDGTNVLDVGNDGMSFNTIGGTWGNITLTGKITGQRSYIIIISGNVSINNTADIGRISEGPGAAISNQGTGTVIINGGILSMTGYNATTLRNQGQGTIIINNGTVSSTGDESLAVVNSAGGTVTINGGTISSTGNGSFAVYNDNNGTVNITGGTIRVTGGTSGSISSAVFIENGAVNITGGTISAESGNSYSYAVYKSGGTVNIGTGAVINGATYGIGGGGEVTVPGTTLAQKLSWLSSNAASNTIYNIEVSASSEGIATQTLSYTGKTNVTINLKGTTAGRTVSLLSNGYLFHVKSGVKLVLDNNIVLSGRSTNTSVLVMVDGGELEMKAGAQINGNMSSSAWGGGVAIFSNGTFTMSGGEISNNKSGSTGGGVCIEKGTFIMTGGIICSNTATNYGGGVCLTDTASIFRMVNGTIYGSNASITTLSNIALSSGAALYVPGGTAQRGTFSGSTWTSKGTLATNNNNLIVSNGDLTP